MYEMICSYLKAETFKINGCFQSFEGEVMCTCFDCNSGEL